MEDESERRIAANEARFREVNEAISRGQWPGDADAVGFRCECALLGCNRLVELTADEYEQVRARARYFVLAPGAPARRDREGRGDPAWLRCGREDRRCR